ncbi:hypothetical protein NHQ30_008350 [Ciborinia camelliae]|nr:hypothetical protein NHQ30_008350 [Ciborinia camelliae]
MAPPSKGFRARQPGKALWFPITITHLAGHMLFLSLYYIPRATRQNPQWTYRNAMTNEFIRIALHHITYLKLILPLSMNPGAEGDRFILIKPSNKKIYKGILANSSVVPATIGGTWYPKLFQPEEQKSVVLHFHGGSFIFGSGRISECADAAELLTKHVADYALFIQYRLAGDPASPFPAALQDAVTAYQYLLDLGISPSRIIVSGDSAGGNIAVALLRYISEQKLEDKDGSEEDILPNPFACTLWSPSIDLASQTRGHIDTHRNYRTDYLAGFTLEWGINLYIPESMEVTGPWFSPLRYPFSTPVPIWMMTGKAEVLTDTIVEFAGKMKDMKGNRVELYEIPNAPHDVFLVGNKMGWDKEAEEAASAAAKFLSDST